MNLLNVLGVVLGVATFEVINLRSDVVFAAEKEPQEGWLLFGVALLLELGAGIFYSTAIEANLPWASFMGGYGIPRLLSDARRRFELPAPPADGPIEDLGGVSWGRFLLHWSR